MTPERINAVIAEWCGCHPNRCPDYYHDLNAVHEAVQILDPGLHDRYNAALNILVDCTTHIDSNEWPSSYFAVINATAPQRCEALLRTLGKWEE